MRMILFFDLPVTTTQNQKDYRTFVKKIRKMGFYMIQESVYVKMVIDQQLANSYIELLKQNVPSKGNIIVLNVTEKQFSKIKILSGEFKNDVLSDDSRTVVL